MRVGLALLASFCIAIGSQPALAMPAADAAAPVGDFLPEGAPSLGPMGYAVFCMQAPSQCAADNAGGSAPALDLDQTTLSLLRTVNTDVNTSIRPRRDMGKGLAADVWRVAPARGDCEDYALTKRAKLLQAGVSPALARIALARTPEGEGHAVLVVRTTQGDVVLDNRHSRIELWSRSDLSFVAVQSRLNPRHWLAASRRGGARAATAQR